MDQAYLREVGEYFSALRGSTPFLSPRDIEVILAWQRDGIPVDVARKGIAETLQRAREGARGRRGGAISLVVCDQAVRRLWNQEAEIGFVPPPFPAPPPVDHETKPGLSGLGGFFEQYRRVCRTSEFLGASHLETVEATLTEIEAKLTALAQPDEGTTLDLQKLGAAFQAEGRRLGAVLEQGLNEAGSRALADLQQAGGPRVERAMLVFKLLGLPQWRLSALLE
jgi:hypothetical protein